MMENTLLLASYDFAFFKAVLLCAVALGLIIFIHELGHFLVAKACGVRCDKFYIGFDFFGLKLCKFKYGETEYGIGVFPLGGYVKMLGQEDNPGETRERIAKAKAAREMLAQNADAAVDKSLLMSDDEIAEAEKLINDPRSYQAKSVPQRMAIIVAGVTMNVILAFVAATCAYMCGTFQTPCVIGDVHPGQAAWEAGLQADDRLEKIEANELQYFEDISRNVALGDNLENGIMIQYRRGAAPVSSATKAFPKKCALTPMLGATASAMPVLYSTPVMPASPTYNTEKELKAGDVLVGINDTPIRTNLEYQKALYATTGENVSLKFVRPSAEAADAWEKALQKLQLGDEAALDEAFSQYIAGAEAFSVMVEPLKARNFGVIFTMGDVQAVRTGENGLESAAKAGIVPGDKIVGFEMTVNGKPETVRNLDPMTFASEVRTQAKAVAAAKESGALQVLNFTILKKATGKEEIVPVEFSLDVFGSDQYLPGCGEVIPEIGLTYSVLRTVSAVIPGSEAEKQGIQPGFVLKSLGVKYDEPKDAELSEKEKTVVSHFQKTPKPMVFHDDAESWLMIYHNVLMYYPLKESSVEATFEQPAAGGKTAQFKTVKLPLSEYMNAYVYHSDLNFVPRQIFIQEGLCRSIALGGEKTWDSLTMVYRMLGKLFSGQVSVKALGGPVLIAQMAYSSAKDGLSTLLIFVCLISANLAVLNLLPIPVLDGGHVVFLLWEGITGKAPNENFMIILSYMGLLLFLGLTIFVLGLDLGFISRF